MSILSSGCNFIQHLLTYFTPTGMLILVSIITCTFLIFLPSVFSCTFPLTQACYSCPALLCMCCVLSHLSRVCLFVTLWTVVHQAPLSMGFSRREYQSGQSFPPPRDLPDPAIGTRSPTLAGTFFTTSATWVSLSWISQLPDFSQPCMLTFLNDLHKFIYSSLSALQLLSELTTLCFYHVDTIISPK